MSSRPGSPTWPLPAGRDRATRSGHTAFASDRLPGAVILRLPAAAVLEREVTLPLAAEREPEGVLRYDMDRLTPFAAEDLFWTWAIEPRDRARGALHLRLSFVPKARLQRVLAALSSIGILVTEIQSMLGAAGAPVRRIALVLPLTLRHYWGRRALHARTLLSAGLVAAW